MNGTHEIGTRQSVVTPIVAPVAAASIKIPVNRVIARGQILAG